MANSGINKAVVMTARSKILRRGEHPSIDRIRIELGNTGSRTTIARYLNELNNSAPKERAYAPSQEIMDCINKISENLIINANEELEKLKKLHANELNTLQEDLTDLRNINKKLEAEVTATYSAHASTTNAYENAKNSIRANEAKILELKTAAIVSTAKLSENETLISAMKNHLESTRGSLLHFTESSKQEREKTEVNFQSQISGFSRQILAHENKIRELEIKLEDKNIEIIRLTKECGTLISEKLLRLQMKDDSNT